jgi:integrase
LLVLIQAQVPAARSVADLAAGGPVALQPPTGVRTVALPPHLVDDVRVHLLRWVGPAPSDLLFTGPKTTELYRATFNNAWDRARRAVGMGDFHFFHDLRHTGNTLAAGTGASTKELMLVWATPALERRSSTSTHRTSEAC